MTPDRILRDLHQLWITLGKQPREGGQGVLRACTMTLFALADESDDPSAIWELLAAVMPRHPSRAILLRFRRGAGREVDARVFAQCWLPFGHRQQICCEQIEITAADGSVADLPPLLGPVAASDLPVVLYCRCPRLFASPHLGALAPEAGRLIVDSALFGDTAAALRMLAGRTGAPPVADLAWTRLTPWREAFAQLFDPPDARASVRAAAELRISAAGLAPSPEVCYMAAWLLDGIAASGGAARAHFDVVPGDHGIRRVSLSGPGLDAAVAVLDDGSMEIRRGDSVRRRSSPSRAPYDVVSEELGITERDSVYERALPAAARLAVSLTA